LSRGGAGHALGALCTSDRNTDGRVDRLQRLRGARAVLRAVRTAGADRQERAALRHDVHRSPLAGTDGRRVGAHAHWRGTVSLLHSPRWRIAADAARSLIT